MQNSWRMIMVGELIGGGRDCDCSGKCPKSQWQEHGGRHIDGSGLRGCVECVRDPRQPPRWLVGCLGRGPTFAQRGR